jgi:glycogen synthase
VKILVVSNFYPPDVEGGYELGCEQVVEALRARGHDVLVLTSAPRRPAPDAPGVLRGLQLADIWDSYSTERHTPAGLWEKHAEAEQIIAFNVHALNKTIADFRPDVVYLWMLAGLGGLGLIGCVHHQRLPWVWHLMDKVPSRLCAFFFRVQPELAREFSRQFRGTFLACSRQLLDDIERDGFTLGDRVELIPNWVAGPLAAPRARYRALGEPLRIVAAAATIERAWDKGIGLLIKAAALLRASGEERFLLDIYGHVRDGWFADLIRTEGLADRVRLLGSIPRSELIARHADYDVFAFPGRVGEPNAFAPLEAMPSGCVLILAREGGNAEWLVHEVDCLKVARTAEGFAEAFGQVIRGEIALAPIGRRAASTVRREFHLDGLIPRIEQCLERASRQSRAGAGSADEAYRLAVLAEKLTHLFIQEPFLV